MLDALIVVAGIALVDSLNPLTIGPALLFTLKKNPGRQVLEFALGYFLVNVAGGILLVLGPGEWLLSLIPHLSDRTKHLLEVAGGVALIAVAVALWIGRRKLGGPKAAGEEEKPGRAGSAVPTGSLIAASELPTAFPYFAAVAAIVAASLSLPEEVLLVVVFNVIFLAPVVGIGIAVGVSPRLRETLIEPVRLWIGVHWPRVLSGFLGLAGVVVLTIGIVGLAKA